MQQKDELNQVRQQMIEMQRQMNQMQQGEQRQQSGMIAEQQVQGIPPQPPQGLGQQGAQMRNAMQQMDIDDEEGVAAAAQAASAGGEVRRMRAKLLRMQQDLHHEQPK